MLVERSQPSTWEWYRVRRLASLAVCVALFGIRAVLAQSAATGTPSVQLLLPAGVAYDAAGNLFVADTRKNQILEVSLAGVTTIVAGTGEQGFAGDGGDATLALLNGPASVAVATDGTIYIADTGNQRIRTVVGGKIQTVAGTGAKGFSGDGGDAHLAKFDTVLALTVDSSGGLLIADSGNHRLRRLSGGILTTIAGIGIQGFAGDGAAASLSQLDTPAGVAVASDGHIFLADSRNHRIRVIATDGTITTFAGSGFRGFSGDGGTATGASLFLPRGIAVMPTGDVIFADSDNQRLRSINARGIITTIAGNGVQGGSAPGTLASTAILDSPRGVALSYFGAPVFADAHNHVVREIAADASLYTLINHDSDAVTVALSAPAGLIYGQGSIAASVSGPVPAAEGDIAFFDGVASAGTAKLTKTTATFSTEMLSAGLHTLTGVFAGDGLHSAAKSSVLAVSILPAPVTAVAHAATVVYGSTEPSLSGTVSGILPRDSTGVAVSFVPTTSDLSPVGSYPITVSLIGLASSNYTLTLAATSGSVQIIPAAAVVAVTPKASYAGLPVAISASIVSSTRGSPSGTITFLDNGSAVASGDITGGTATAIYINPGMGVHSISAAYGGDHNFLAATSPAASIVVNVMPDFTLTVTSNTTQSVPGGGIATYALQVASQPGPFSGAVSLSVSGLPSGAIAIFSPAVVIPGNGSSTASLSIQTAALSQRISHPELDLAVLIAFGISGARKCRSRGKLANTVLLMFAMLALFFVSGCGDRRFPVTSRVAQSFPMTVTATSTNLAGVVVAHTATILLAVQ